VDWQTNLNFDSAGGRAFGNITEQMFSKYGPNSVQDQLAVVLDGNVISSPVIQGAITGGSAQITGSFTQAQATNLANVLNYGALPLTFTKESVQSISPSLGSNQLRAGLIAGAIGLFLFADLQRKRATVPKRLWAGALLGWGGFQVALRASASCCGRRACCTTSACRSTTTTITSTRAI